MLYQVFIMQRFVLSEFTIPCESEEFEVKCKECGNGLKPIRKGSPCKHSAEYLNSKPQMLPVLPCRIQSSSDYVNLCVLHHSLHALSFNYWDSESTQLLHEPYNGHFGVKTTSTTMKRYFGETEITLFNEIKSELKHRQLSIQFDIGSRMGRSFLGISAQYMKNFEIKIAHLAMVTLHHSHTGAYIKTTIENVLQKFEINMAQVHSITTDNGANVINASREILENIVNNECTGVSLVHNLI